MMITFAELVSGKKSRAAAPPSLDGPRRAGRAAKSTSTRQGAKALSAVAGEARRTRPGNPSQYAHLAAAGDISRFAAFAAASDAGAAELQAAAAPRSTTPMSGDMSVAAMRREIVASGGRIPGVETPEQMATFVAALVAKVQGQPAVRASAKPDLSTAAVASVATTAAKTRGQRYDMTTPEGIAASAVAAARRAGMIR